MGISIEGMQNTLSLPFFGTVLASKFGNLDLKPLSVALNVIQACALWRGTQDSEKFQTTHKAQFYFNIANLTVNFWSFGCLVNELGKIYPFFNMNLTWTDLINSFSTDIWTDVHPIWTADARWRFGAYGYGAMIIGALATCVAVGLINKYHASSQKQLTIEEYGSEDPVKQEMLRQEVEISWNRPLGQKFAQFIYVSQLCLNISLAALSSSRIYFALNLALGGYSLYQITERKWLNVGRIKKWKYSVENRHIEAVKAVYHCFLMPFSGQKKQESEDCAICLEDNPDVYFHGNHLFHEKCFIKLAVKKSDDFVAISSFDRQERRDNKGNRSIVYSGRMLNSTKLGCPTCREKPFYNELDIVVREAASSTTAKITWVDEL